MAEQTAGRKALPAVEAEARRVMAQRICIVVILVALLGFAGFTVFKQVKAHRAAALAKEGQEVVPVVATTTVERGTIEQTFILDGTVEADTEVGIYSKIPGKLSRVRYDEGDWVKKGALVAELERKEILAQVNQAKAAVAAAEVNVRKAREGYKLQTVSTDTSVQQAEANLATAKARLAQARTGLNFTDKDVQTSVASAREAVRQAQARLDALKTGSRAQEKKIAQEQVAQAKANMDTAKRDLERARKLLSAQAISQQQFDAAQLRFDVAAAQYKTALQQASLVEEGPRSEEIRAAEAQLEQAKAMLAKAEATKLQLELRQKDIEAAEEGVRQAEAALQLARAAHSKDVIAKEDISAAEAMVAQARANLQLAQAQLQNTYIYAPASGYVVKRYLDPGENVGTGQPIMTLVDNRFVKVKCALSEDRRRYVHEGQQVKVRFDALPGAEYVGVVSVVSAAADPQSRVFEVEVRVENARGLIQSGMFARVEVVQARQTDVVLLPYEAVVQGKEGASVYVVEGGRARLRPVRLGLRREDKVAVLSGLAAGEEVVVRGQRDLQDGEKVQREEADGGGLR